MSDTSPVVVGIDGSAAALEAVRFAAAQASARRRSLVLVHAVGDGEPAEQRDRVLARARSVAEQTAPALDVRSELAAWDRAAVLAVAAADACLLVVGMAGKNDPPESAARSVALDLLARDVDCPLTVVRAGHRRHRALVVALVDGIGDDDVVAEGALLARSTGTPLVVDSLPAGSRSTDASLAAARRDFPDVEITDGSSSGLEHLLDRAEGTQALVVGLPTGFAHYDAPARVAVRRAPCPVVVVRTSIARSPDRPPRPLTLPTERSRS
ncbi:hypothetical protein GCM10009836_72420 [Pseudonocardia ailaonensis]|uniref:UspA domain-containing protein n=1 Tax=Pseudonocardia ailaonensis TaxID=367279 RepID=A0ABN2NPH6_9PSEU